MSAARRRPRGQLLRRPAPLVRRQRGQGDGERQAGLSGGQPRCWRAPRARAARPTRCSRRCDDELRATVHEVVRLTPTIVEVVVRAPMAARAFQPGQFYRLQNFETLAPGDRRHAPRHGGPGADRRLDRQGRAACSRPSCWRWAARPTSAPSCKPGEPVILMGPTGTPTEIPEGETVLLVGGGLGNAVLFSIGQALRARGNRVLYFAGYKRTIDRYKVEEIERAADTIVWCCDEAPGFAPDRPAGPRLRRQHRGGDGRLRQRRAGRDADLAGATSTASSPSARTA